MTGITQNRTMIAVVLVILALALGIFVYSKYKDPKNEPDKAPAMVRAAQPSARSPTDCYPNRLVKDYSGRREHFLELSCPAFAQQKLYFEEVPGHAYDQPLYKKLRECGNITPTDINKVFYEYEEDLAAFLKRRKNMKKVIRIVRTTITKGKEAPQHVVDKEIRNLIRYLMKRIRSGRQMIDMLMKIHLCFLPVCNDCKYYALPGAFQRSIVFKVFNSIGHLGHPGTDPRAMFDDDSSDDEPTDSLSFGGLFGEDSSSTGALEAAMRVDLSKIVV